MARRKGGGYNAAIFVKLRDKTKLGVFGGISANGDILMPLIVPLV